MPAQSASPRPSPATRLPRPGRAHPRPQPRPRSKKRHRSPLRYPGGKSWLTPLAHDWLRAQARRPRELIEPFAGAAHIGLFAVDEDIVDRAVLVELDGDVAALWQTLIEGEAAPLARRIMDFELTEESLRQLVAAPPPCRFERAFCTLVRNRVNRGGILADGARPMRLGERGAGAGSRWYPETLRDRVLRIHEMRQRLGFIHGDGLDVLRRNRERADVVSFIDPPYSAAGKSAGKRLYNCWQLDHEELFEVAASLRGDFLMTHENAPSIRGLAAAHGFEVKAVAMQNTHGARLTELLIGRDLDWAR